MDIENADPIDVEFDAAVEAKASPEAIMVFAELIVILEERSSPSENWSVVLSWEFDPR